MRNGAISRRGFLAGLGGTAVTAFAVRAGHATTGAQDPVFVSCRIDSAARYRLSGFDETGRLRFDMALPGRGHAIALRPGDRTGVVFARRPGTFAVVFDAVEGITLNELRAQPGRHLYGHGLYSADGRLLFTTENDYEAGRGMIGVRDATDGYRRIGEIPSHGIGPHEARLMPDGATLAIANGGVRTHPDSGRAKLNLETMQPSLTLVEAKSGRLLAEHRLAPRLHQLSIRHLDVAPDGRIAIAMQYEGPKGDRVPLVGLLDGASLRLFDPPAAIERHMRHYVGAVVFDAGHTTIAASCPRGNLMTVWDAASGALLGQAALPDTCGVCATELAGEFLLTGAGGRLATYDVAHGALSEIASATGGDWDNHAVMRTPRTIKQPVLQIS